MKPSDEFAALRQQIDTLTAQNAKFQALSERYDVLLKALAENGKQHDAAQDDEERLRCSRLAQRLLLQFLWADPAVMVDRRITAPLADINIAAHDAGKGAHPDLFDHPPVGSGRKPTGTSRETIQGVILAVVHGMKRTGRGTAAAIDWATDEARRAGVCTEAGGFIKRKQLQSWWQDLNRKEPKLPAEAVKVFNDCRMRIESQPAWRQRQQMEVAMRLLLTAMAYVAPRSAPNPAHRAGQ